MSRSRGKRLRILAALMVMAASAGPFAMAQQKPADEWDTTKARGQTREIDFATGGGGAQKRYAASGLLGQEAVVRRR